VKNDVNVPSKRNKHKNLEEKYFLVGVLNSRTKQDPEPDLLVTGTDLRILIHTNLSRIRNTDL
jgi:hypothetical protein